jgi:hypothetical protein
MSVASLFTRAAPRTQPESAKPADLVAHPYLTDGIGLYRFLGWIIDGCFAEFEDCHSLEVVLVPTSVLFGRGLCPVTPAQALP